MNERWGMEWDGSTARRLAWEGDTIVEHEEDIAFGGRAADTCLAPGLIDLQINGAGGVHFGNPDLTVDQVRAVARLCWAHGVTHFLPTLITDSVVRLEGALRRLTEAAETSDLRPSILGFHLEGPFISPEDGPRGAHPLEHCQTPDWEVFQRLQEAARGKIKLVTLAPELPGALPFIEKLVLSGLEVAIGHTAATRDAVHAAVVAGARLSTHLGNGAHDRIQRHRNYFFDQLADDRLFASIIADGHHLPPDLVKIIYRVKGHLRTILVSDAVQYAGLPPGIYDGGYRKFEVRADGFIGVVGEPNLAGAGLMLIRGIENLARFAQTDIQDGLWAANHLPALFLGLSDRLGKLAPGYEASFTRLHWEPHTGNLQVRETVVAGKTVYSTVS